MSDSWQVKVGHPTRVLTPEERDEIGRMAWNNHMAKTTGAVPGFEPIEPGQGALATDAERAANREAWAELDVDEREWFIENYCNLVYTACAIMRNTVRRT